MNNDKWKYTVYVHINRNNQKAYVGITTKEPEERWMNGYGYRGQPFYSAILKYGWDSFDHVILESGLTESEACNKEQFYIQQYDSYKHGYNSTKGGFSEKSREWFCKMSEEEKENRRKEISRLSSEALSKKKLKYICVNTQKIYSSLEEIEKEYGIKADTIRNRCLYNRIGYEFDPITKRQLIFLYYLPDKNIDYSLKSTILRIARRPVICLETNDVFCNVAEASRVMNISYNNIISNCKNEYSYANGYHFMFYIDYKNKESELENMKKNNGRKRKIVLINTKEIFDSISAAARIYKINIHSILNCLQGKYRYGGYYNNVPLVWQYYEDYIIDPKSVNVSGKRKLVHCLTNDKYFASLAVAGKYYHTDPNDISKCCMGELEYNGRDESGNRLKWEFYYPLIEDNMEVIKDEKHKE